MMEIKPVVTENSEFEYRGKSAFFALFGILVHLGLNARYKAHHFSKENSCSRRRLQNENSMNDLSLHVFEKGDLQHQEN